MQEKQQKWLKNKAKTKNHLFLPYNLHYQIIQKVAIIIVDIWRLLLRNALTFYGI